MPLSEVEDALRPIARERIAKGQLPGKEPAQVWGGPGSGELCSLCAKPIERFQIEFEIEERGPTAQVYRFHSACLSVWQLECARADPLNKPRA